MSWSDKNITEPQGDFGAAAENNDYGYGQAAANNSDGWGSGHVMSLGHAVTNLFGKLATGITDGWDLFISTNDTEPLNTANRLNGTSGGGSLISFTDLTGVTITSTVGTGVLGVVANDFVFTSTGYIDKIIVDDNGTERTFILTKGSDSIVSNDGVLTGTLTGITWSQGVDTAISEGTQTSLLSWNKYTNRLKYSNIFKNTYSDWGILNGGRVTADRTITDPLGGTTASTLEFRYSNKVSAIFQVGVAFTDTRIFGLWAKSNTVVGKKFSLRVDGVNNPQTSNDFTTTATWQYFEFEVKGNGSSPVNIYIANESGAIDGKIDIWRANFYDKTEESEYIETLANPIIGAVIPEDINNSGTDVIGNAITRDLLIDGYNFSDNNTYLDTILLNRTGAGTDGLFFKKMTDTLPMDICGDDVMQMRINSSNFLEVTFNAVTLVSLQLVSKNQWYFVKFSQDGAGLGKIYVGTDIVAPTLNHSGAVGLPTATSTTMKFGSI